MKYLLYGIIRLMKTALVTGFETFGEYATNPSEWLVLSADKQEVNDHKINSLVFPSIVTIPEKIENPGNIIVDKAKEIGASAIISFGITSNASGFRIEQTGTNWINNEKYCTAFENNKPLEQSRPIKEQLKNDLSLWDMEKMKELFAKSNIPFEDEISNNPGYYSCNGLIYRTLLAMQQKNLNIPYLFVHFPCTEESIQFITDFDREKKILIKKELTLKALEIILKSYK